MEQIMMKSFGHCVFEIDPLYRNRSLVFSMLVLLGVEINQKQVGLKTTVVVTIWGKKYLYLETKVKYNS